MNRVKLLVVFLIISLYGCQNKNHHTVISGSITGGELNQSIEYSTSEYGGCFWAFPNSVEVDSLGNFEITLDIKEPRFIQPLIGTYAYSKLLVEPGEMYKLVIDLKRKSIMLSCKDEKVQELYRSLPTDQIYNVALKYKNDSISSNSINEIISIKNAEIEQFKQAFNAGEITESFYEIVKTDRTTYYSLIASRIIYIHFWNKQIDSTLAINAWSEIFQMTNVETPLISNSFWYYQFLKNYLEYKTFLDKANNLEKPDKFHNQETIHTYKCNFAKKHLSGDALEYFTARYLYDECIQMKYQKELITIFDEFRQDFPNSEFTKYLDPMITPIDAFHKIKDQSYPEGIKLVDNFQDFNSFEECIGCFKGQKVFVDVWATWCLPCRAAFKHKNELKKLLQSKGYELLYISIDKNEKDNQWKEMIRFYTLEGNHVRANDKFRSNLYYLFNNTSSMSIPWYMIIDEDGNIVNKHAKSPALIEELEKQLK